MSRPTQLIMSRSGLFRQSVARSDVVVCVYLFSMSIATENGNQKLSVGYIITRWRSLCNLHNEDGRSEAV